MMATLSHGGHIDPPMSRSMWDWIHSERFADYFGIMEVQNGKYMPLSL